MSRKPQLVAIVGGSGSGKSWLAEQLRRRLGKEAGHISLDDFYRDRSHLPPGRRATVNYDHPRAIDWEALHQVVRDCTSGRPTRLPRYDFSAHVRLKEWAYSRPKPLILLDGLWLLRPAALREVFALSIFLDCPESLRLERRLARDTRERRRTPEFIVRQFNEHVVPMHELYVQPQSRWAEIILNGVPGPRQINRLTARLHELLTR